GTKMQPKPHIFPLVNSSALDMVDLLKELYKDYIDQRSNQMASPFGPFGPRVPVDQGNSTERAIRLSLAANTKDNSVVVNCPDVLWPELRDLIKELDKEGADTTKRIRVYNPTGPNKVDPIVLQQVVDVITGNRRQGIISNDPASQFRGLMNQNR